MKYNQWQITPLNGGLLLEEKAEKRKIFLLLCLAFLEPGHVFI